MWFFSQLVGSKIAYMDRILLLISTYILFIDLESDWR